MHAAARPPGAADANECLSPLSGSDNEREGGGGMETKTVHFTVDAHKATSPVGYCHTHDREEEEEEKSVADEPCANTCVPILTGVFTS